MKKPKQKLRSKQKQKLSPSPKQWTSLFGLNLTDEEEEEIRVLLSPENEGVPFKAYLRKLIRADLRARREEKKEVPKKEPVKFTASDRMNRA